MDTLSVPYTQPCGKILVFALDAGAFSGRALV